MDPIDMSLDDIISRNKKGKKGNGQVKAKSVHPKKKFTRMNAGQTFNRFYNRATQKKNNNMTAGQQKGQQQLFRNAFNNIESTNWRQKNQFKKSTNMFKASPLAARLTPRTSIKAKQFRARIGNRRFGTRVTPGYRQAFQGQQAFRYMRNSYQNAQGASRGARLATLRRAKIALNRAKAALNRASLRAGQGAFGGAGARGRGARGRGGRGGTFGGRGRGRGWSNQAQPVDGQKANKMANAMGISARPKFNRQSFLNQRRGLPQQSGGFKPRNLQAAQQQFRRSFQQNHQQWGRTKNVQQNTRPRVMSVTFDNSRFAPNEVDVLLPRGPTARGRGARRGGRGRGQTRTFAPLQPFQVQVAADPVTNDAQLFRPKKQRPDSDPLLQHQIKQLKPTVKVDYDMDSVNFHQFTATTGGLNARFSSQSQPPQSQDVDDRMVF